MNVHWQPHLYYYVVILHPQSQSDFPYYNNEAGHEQVNSPHVQVIYKTQKKRPLKQSASWKLPTRQTAAGPGRHEMPILLGETLPVRRWLCYLTK
jgi:hypothetical protein